MIVSALCGAGVLVLLAPRRRAAAPAPLAVGAVVAVIWGWGVAQYPYLLPQSSRSPTAPRRARRSPRVLIVFGVAVVLVLPAIALLFTLASAA